MMDLQPMFEMQRVLDDRIIEEKGLEGQDLIPNTFLASLVELAECCNEWREFKHWSKNNQPRTKAVRNATMKEEDKAYYNPLLEEYVDKLHFLLSIGNQLGFSKNVKSITPKHELNLTNQFIALFHITSSLFYTHYFYQFELALEMFFGLGEMLGFTEEQIEKWYKEKNKINHQRQATAY